MLVLLLFGLCLIASRGYACAEFPQPPLPTATITVTAGGSAHTFMVELALTDEQKACGLMGRKPLAAGQGMLFDEQNAVPFSRRMRGTRKPVAAVLELAGGSAARLGIGIDDQVSLPWNERR